MRAFVVLCLVAVASAQYDYAPQTSSGGGVGGFSGGGLSGLSGGGLGGLSGGGLSGLSGGGLGGLSGGGLGGLSGGALGGLSGGGLSGLSGGGLSGLGGGSLGSGSLGGFSGGVSGGSAQPVSYGPQQPSEEYSKEFYSYSAPENEFNVVGGNDDYVSSVKKNLRVIFIKGPETNGIERAAQQLAQFTTNDRTVVYVLTKQADAAELANKLSAIPQTISQKPEVHFVKYRTPADAENAQRTIQSQYDSLPGSTTTTHGGQAQVLDFASKAPARNVAPSNQYVPPAQPQASYLPPGKKF